jgi:hypothetical protein
MDDAFSPPTLSDETLNPAAEDASRAFVGRWNRLVSSTNWEKGRIITEWREALITAGAPHTDYSDDAWSRCVEGVSGQHVGRLRRVFQRFGQTHDQYAGLFWSHFQAALDWNDAEMWLEGAGQNSWSVMQMRRARWETLGSVGEQEPQEEELVTIRDEDFELPLDGPAIDLVPQPAEEQERGRPELMEESSPYEAEDDDAAAESGGTTSEPGLVDAEAAAAELVRPFAHLTELPSDLAKAFEDFKLAILRHKAAGWLETSPAEVMNSLDALKELVTAPSHVGR